MLPRSGALALRRVTRANTASFSRALCVAAAPSSSPRSTAAPPPAFDVADFTAKFLAEIKSDLPHATDPAHSSSLLRRLVKAGHLKFTDMRDAPEKFFLAHRLLAGSGTSGFGIRFTVQYNLFAGSILGLGGTEQVAMLDEIQREGQLGCFLLTEKQAGVLSGLIVETTCAPPRRRRRRQLGKTDVDHPTPTGASGTRRRRLSNCTRRRPARPRTGYRRATPPSWVRSNIVIYMYATGLTPER